MNIAFSITTDYWPISPAQVAHISRLGWEIWATREGDMGHLSLMIENAFFIQLLIMQYNCSNSKHEMINASDNIMIIGGLPVVIQED